jgi:VIT1/CCC1 family predicted Fe2+/Mn2+ transporter
MKEVQTAITPLRNEAVMSEPETADPLARQLVLDELLDLSLYQSLRNVARGELREILDQLIPIEQRHFEFWQDFFYLRVDALDLGRRLKLAFLTAVCRFFGAPAIHLVLEAIEVYGVQKYLRVWSAYGSDGPLGAAVRNILEDEFKHEDEVVTGAEERKLYPARVRDIFLGLNDGLVEILGAVSGFYAAFGNPLAVLAAGLTVAVAGALSMAAGAWIAVSSESEVQTTEIARRRFLGESVSTTETAESPLASAIVVGASYLAGALVPVLPVLSGAMTVLPSVLTAGSLIILVSIMVAFLSGMDIKRRVVTNLLIIAAAVGISFAIGLVTKVVRGASV